ncbi:MAG TPA: beta-propeller fold lactonase family protein [Blastocatellia bacterium]|nr:beta-propeller fold lactonase family protein [Blastocatellia bacterium]
MPGRPFKAVSTSDGCWIFVSVNGANQAAPHGVQVLQRDHGQIKTKNLFQTQGAPFGMVLTHDGSLLAVVDGDGVAFMDAKTMISGRGDPILGHISDGPESGTIYVDVTADDKFLFVCNERAQSITVINLEKARANHFSPDSVVGRIPAGIAPVGLAFSPDQKFLYTTSEGAPRRLNWPAECKLENPAAGNGANHQMGAIIVIDVAIAEKEPARSVVSIARAGCSPVRVAMSTTGDKVFVTVRGSDSLLAFDRAKLKDDPEHALIATVPVGLSPVGVVVVNSGRLILVINSNRFANNHDERQSLTAIDSSKVASGSSAVLGKIPAGAFPREFCQLPDGRTLIVTNFFSRELEVIDLTRLKIN